MDLSAQLDIYCERLGPGFWAEPVNALSNMAFILAALWAGRRLNGSGLRRGFALAGLLLAIGVGSFLFHSFATLWAALADVIPIAAFVLTYVFTLHRDVIGLSQGMAWLSVAAFVAYAGLIGTGFAALPFFEVSAGYWPIVPALLFYAIVLRARPRLAGGLAGASVLLSLSLTARSIDAGVCAAIPLGTHFLWHILNAILLAWLIDIYRRHMLAGAGRRG